MSLINKILKTFVGDKTTRDLKELQPYIEMVNVETEKLITLSNDELRKVTIEIKEQISDYVKDENNKIQELKDSIIINKLSIDKREGIYDEVDKIEKQIDEKIEDVLLEVLPRTFALVKETARRFTENEEIEVTATQFDRELAARKDSVEIDGEKAVFFNSWTAGGTKVIWNMIHYDVQIIGGVSLHKGKIAEMATGEGKTLVATFPVFLNALSGRGVHLVTVNDYLAKRDAEWMGPLYEFHGLSVDCIDNHQPNSDARRKAYRADITFGTNNEFGFDYLRDNMAINSGDLVQRRHNYVIVDEVDSVLVDDARTPLIISGPTPRGDMQMFDELKSKISRLYNDQKNLTTTLLSEAKKLIKQGGKDKELGAFKLLQAFKGLPKNKAIIKYISEDGIKTLLHKTENIYLQDNAKRMPEVTDDLFFVIDEKNNGIDLTDKGINVISSDTNDDQFFILPDIGFEINKVETSGIPAEQIQVEKDKLINEYGIKSERVHTINQLLRAYAMFEIDVEYVIMDNKIKIVDEQTGRIMEGRRYSDGLHQAIEAKENVKVEAATQTFATITLQNYFRMYHKLAGMTGTAETEAGEFWDIYKLDVVVIPTNRPIIRDDREDLVYKTKREKYKAVIEEITSLVEKGRPVLVGTTSVEISEHLSRILKMRNIKHNVLNAKLHQREADIVAEAGNAGTVTIATNMAGRGTDIKLSKEVVKDGGLAIIGTERHDSRRVDRQLRGRAGRQGDPGSSQFFVSLEDDLMRLFGSDRISKMMDKMGLKDGEVIQHSMISKSIERAQKKVEENNFGIRKRLLEYDDVMNSQREVIYSKRRHALDGERLGVDISNMMYDTCESLVNESHGNIDFNEFKFELIRTLSIESPIDEKEYLAIKPSDLVDKLYSILLETHKRKVGQISTEAFPVIKNVYETQSHLYENIVVPISDGAKVFNVVVNLKKAYETEGQELVESYNKSAILLVIDDVWKEHLREMDELKQSVQNASYEQKDPLLIYKFESYELFKTVIDKVNKDVVSLLMKGKLHSTEPEEIKEAHAPKKLDMSKYSARRDSEEGSKNKEKKKPQPVRVEKKVGRNEPCPCGSGKKFKNCHGKGVAE